MGTLSQHYSIEVYLCGGPTSISAMDLISSSLLISASLFLLEALEIFTRTHITYTGGRVARQHHFRAEQQKKGGMIAKKNSSVYNPTLQISSHNTHTCNEKICIGGAVSAIDGEISTSSCEDASGPIDLHRQVVMRSQR